MQKTHGMLLRNIFSKNFALKTIYKRVIDDIKANIIKPPKTLPLETLKYPYIPLSYKYIETELSKSYKDNDNNAFFTFSNLLQALVKQHINEFPTKNIFHENMNQITKFANYTEIPTEILKQFLDQPVFCHGLKIKLSTKEFWRQNNYIKAWWIQNKAAHEFLSVNSPTKAQSRQNLSNHFLIPEKPHLQNQNLASIENTHKNLDFADKKNVKFNQNSPFQNHFLLTWGEKNATSNNHACIFSSTYSNLNPTFSQTFVGINVLNSALFKSIYQTVQQKKNQNHLKLFPFFFNRKKQVALNSSSVMTFGFSAPKNMLLLLSTLLGLSGLTINIFAHSPFHISLILNDILSFVILGFVVKIYTWDKLNGIISWLLTCANINKQIMESKLPYYSKISKSKNIQALDEINYIPPENYENSFLNINQNMDYINFQTVPMLQKLVEIGIEQTQMECLLFYHFLVHAKKRNNTEYEKNESQIFNSTNNASYHAQMESSFMDLNETDMITAEYAIEQWLTNQIISSSLLDNQNSMNSNIDNNDTNFIAKNNGNQKIYEFDCQRKALPILQQLGLIRSNLRTENTKIEDTLIGDKNLQKNYQICHVLSQASFILSQKLKGYV